MALGVLLALCCREGSALAAKQVGAVCIQYPSDGHSSYTAAAAAVEEDSRRVVAFPYMCSLLLVLPGEGA